MSPNTHTASKLNKNKTKTIGLMAIYAVASLTGRKCVSDHSMEMFIHNL